MDRAWWVTFDFSKLSHIDVDRDSPHKFELPLPNSSMIMRDRELATLRRYWTSLISFMNVDTFDSISSSLPKRVHILLRMIRVESSAGIR